LWISQMALRRPFAEINDGIAWIWMPREQSKSIQTGVFCSRRTTYFCLLERSTFFNLRTCMVQ
jgi:hypothetical protein